MNEVNGTLYLRRISLPDADLPEYQADFSTMGRIADENVFSKVLNGDAEVEDFLVNQFHLGSDAGTASMKRLREYGKAELPGLRIEETKLAAMGMGYTKIVR